MTEIIPTDLYFDDEGECTETSLEQQRIEFKIKKQFRKAVADDQLKLLKSKHINYCKYALNDLSSAFECLDSSQPWLAYWNLHALDILNAISEETDDEEEIISNIEEDDEFIVENIDDNDEKDDFSLKSLSKRMVEFARHRQTSIGGFEGAPQMGEHLASSYAMINALMIIGTKQSYSIINREKMYEFLMRRKHSSGGFTMCQDGELDVRGTYCALSIARLCNLQTDELLDGVMNFLISCQTYEGGVAGTPGSEAHGGYTYCGLAAALIVEQYYEQTGRKLDKTLDYELMFDWVVCRQMKLEGGFQGRTNKLVDACYTWWQGAVAVLLHQRLNIDIAALAMGDEANNDDGDDDARERRQSIAGSWLLIDQIALQRYVLACCQDERGGLFDKPGKPRDFYHTCYALSGLSAAQFGPDSQWRADQKVREQYYPVVVGRRTNKVTRVDLLHCIRYERVKQALEHFSKLKTF